MDTTSSEKGTFSRRRFLALAASVPALAVARAAAQEDATPAQIAVQAGQELWRIPPTVRGFGFAGGRSDAAFMPEYRKLGPGLLRFPPGEIGDQQDLAHDVIDEPAEIVKAVGGDLVIEVRLRG